MKGLLIAYAFSPQKTVGALRPTYWAEEISGLSDLELDVVTATPLEGDEGSYKRFYVENTASSIWSTFVKDEGLTWRKNLEDFFEKNGVEEYDFALITGGPFFHFSIGKYLKRKGLKVIFDFRDPFSYNPRHKERGLKRMIKERFERKCLQSADFVLTVNDACHEYIGKGMKLNRAVLPNGFDERVITPELKKSENNYDFFYGGKFYWEPTTFLDVLGTKHYTFCHAGRPQKYQHSYLQDDAFNALGMLSQKEMYAELAKAEIGVVFTIDVPFESTTKIYDYLALGKKILIVTQGEPHTGVLKRELENYPMYRWVRNNKEEIIQGIEELKALDVVTVDTDRFSRRASLIKLINELKSLFNG